MSNSTSVKADFFMMSTMKLISSHIVQLHGAYAAVRNMFTIAKNCTPSPNCETFSSVIENQNIKVFSME